MYTIRYQHAGPQRADTLRDALALVNRSVLHVLGMSYVTPVVVRAEDGRYCYLSQADADADETGETAFAVISRAGQDE